MLQIRQQMCFIAADVPKHVFLKSIVWIPETMSFMLKVLNALFRIHLYWRLTASVKKTIFSEPETFSLVQIARNEKSRSSRVSSTKDPLWKSHNFCNETKFQQEQSMNH